MFFNFGFSEPMTVTLEHYIGNALVQSRRMSAPPAILQAQFIQLVEEVASQSQPMKLRMVRWEDVGENGKKIECYVEFKNWKDEDETENSNCS